MGLLSRFARSLPAVGHDATTAGADTVLGAAGGGALGAVSGMGEPDEFTARTLGGGLGGGAAAGTMGLRRVIMALAREMKKQRPDVPDEEIMKAAEAAVKQQAGGDI